MRAASSLLPGCADGLSLLVFGGEDRCELQLPQVLWSAALLLNSAGEQTPPSAVQQLPIPSAVQGCLNAGQA